MKKVLSVLLAAAMVMGMSVSAFAAGTTFTPSSASSSHTIYGGDETVDPVYFDSNSTLTWGDVGTFDAALFVERGTSVTVYTDDEVKDKDNVVLEAGDILYFPFKYNAKVVEDLPSNWNVKINNAEFVDDAGFVKIDTAVSATSTIAKVIKTMGSAVAQEMVMVKVVLEDDVDFYSEDDVEFFVYLHDTKTSLGKLEVEYAFANYSKTTLTEESLDWVVTNTKPTTYTYKEGEKSAYATIDFNDLAYGEFKMYGGEKYTLSASAKYNNALSKEYDTDVEVITFRLGNVNNIDLVFPASKDAYQVVAVVDGELVPVEATYVEDHKFQSGEKADGYLVEDAEYTAYAVIDADVEIVVEETEVEAPVVEAEKANPETGAADFVGAAVAMAVVSVAAAGALALKK